jgi:hypothetical protein
MTNEQIKQMPYGYKFVGQQLSLKLRFKADFLDVLAVDPAMLMFQADMTIAYNGPRTHGHIAVVTSNNNMFLWHFNKAKLRTEAILALRTANHRLEQAQQA